MSASSQEATNGRSGVGSGRISWTVSSAVKTGRRTPMPQPRTADRSKPTLLVQASLAVHVGAAVVLVARPHLWPWVLAAVVVDHILLTAAGLWPRSKLLGPNWTALPERAVASGAVAITIDDGPDPAITP